MNEWLWICTTQVDRAEEQQNVDVKVTSKKIRAEQEKELKQFRESLKQEVKLMKQEVELQTPKDRRKDELKRRKEMLERDQQRREQLFLSKLSDTHENQLRRLTDSHQEKIALLDRQFLQQKQQLMRQVHIATKRGPKSSEEKHFVTNDPFTLPVSARGRHLGDGGEATSRKTSTGQTSTQRHVLSSTPSNAGKRGNVVIGTQLNPYRTLVPILVSAKTYVVFNYFLRWKLRTHNHVYNFLLMLTTHYQSQGSSRKRIRTSQKNDGSAGRRLT